MKIRTLALVLTSLASATVCAAAPSAAGAVPAIGETVAQLESRYPGMVVAIAFDAAGDWTWTQRRSRCHRAKSRRSRPGPPRSPT
jgi:hypothetical protein